MNILQSVTMLQESVVTAIKCIEGYAVKYGDAYGSQATLRVLYDALDRSVHDVMAVDVKKLPDQFTHSIVQR